MLRRTFLIGAASAVALRAEDLRARGRRISEEAIGIDSHIDTIQGVLMGGADISRRLDRGHVDIPRLHEGGIKAPFFALFVPVYYKGADAVRRTLDLRDAMQNILDNNADKIELARNSSDIVRIVKSGKISALLTIEGGHQIDDDLAVLRMYYRLGIRSMTLSHFRNNNWADSSTDKPVHNGLTDFGKDVVREMNRLGMMVDVSHVSDKTFFDTVAVSSKPVILSHSSCRAISDVPRNASDEMLRALAANGGVIGINFGEGFINQKDAAALRKIVASPSQAPDLTGKALDEYAERGFHEEFGKRLPVAATVQDAAAHVDHAVKVAGIDHVGIGSDFDGIAGPPKGLDDVSKMPNLIAELLKRDYSDDNIKKIFGGNYLRLIREVTGA
ncbi:MAG: dipeptidase [Acidobacteriaceae bacterium]|nr:dipeptidase [Acidobacteriaceae bacterium]